MSNNKTVLFMLCETALHAGSGSELGIVDLPIQREKHTNYPKVDSSSLKGCLREAFNTNDKKSNISENIKLDKQELISIVFGPEDDGQRHSGSVAFCDARLLLFPVKSVKGVFAWITCPGVIKKFISDMELAGISVNLEVPDIHTVALGSKIIINDDEEKGSVILEEFTFNNVVENEKCSDLADWISEHSFPQSNECNYLKNWLKEKIIILDDNDFKDFVTMSTEVVTRIKINHDTGTVKDGALFTEEYLPSDAFLYSMIMASGLFSDEKNKKRIEHNLKTCNLEAEDMIIKYIKEMMPGIIQLGGNMSLGKGLVRTSFYSKEGNGNVNFK